MELTNFNAQNTVAWQTVEIANSDYLLARLGFLHGYASAKHLAHQSIEKFLKALIYYKDKTTIGTLSQEIGRANMHKIFHIYAYISDKHNIKINSLENMDPNYDIIFQSRYADNIYH